MSDRKLDNGLFVFTRDLRLSDNTGLHHLTKSCKNVYLIFVFTPEQVGSGNAYKSNRAVQFMLESLEDLQRASRGSLHFFYGKSDKVVEQCIREWDIQMVAFHLDVTPYSQERSKHIQRVCEKHDVQCHAFFDAFLHEPGSIVNGSGHTYVKFTPYYTSAKEMKVPAPLNAVSTASFRKTNKGISLAQARAKFVRPLDEPSIVQGGRSEALKQLRKARAVVSRYASKRDDPNVPTTLLSAYLKFGCLSAREVYHAFKSNTTFTRQLYWRDFYANVTLAFPHVLRGHNLNPKYDKLKWRHNERWLQAWKEGNTGIPLVDASQRQLLSTGWTHNRCRMVSSSVLTKLMLIHWRHGEKFYAQHLVDYDPANNNGGWQWSAGGGSDAQPWFRYFNPFSQSKEHDPDCTYIKQWVPELADVPAEAIHAWEEEWANFKDVTNYPKPIFSYKSQKEKSIQMYKDAL